MTSTQWCSATRSSSVEGSLKGAKVIAVDYDLARLPQCRAKYMGFDAWGISAYWNFVGGTLKLPVGLTVILLVLLLRPQGLLGRRVARRV